MATRTGSIGSSLNLITSHLPAAVRAVCELRRMQKNGCPKRGASYGHRRNIAEHRINGTLGTEHSFVLIDYRNNNEKMKWSVLTHLEVFKRNKTLKGLGMAWARCDRP